MGVLAGTSAVPLFFDGRSSRPSHVFLVAGGDVFNVDELGNGSVAKWRTKSGGRNVHSCLSRPSRSQEVENHVEQRVRAVALHVHAECDWRTHPSVEDLIIGIRHVTLQISVEKEKISNSDT